MIYCFKAPSRLFRRLASQLKEQHATFYLNEISFFTALASPLSSLMAKQPVGAFKGILLMIYCNVFMLRHILVPLSTLFDEMTKSHYYEHMQSNLVTIPTR